MNPRLNVTQKTYYALGVLASVLNLAGGALYLAGIYAALLFNIASFLAGAMMLMTGACAGVKSLTGRLSLLAAALVVFSPDGRRARQTGRRAGLALLCRALLEKRASRCTPWCS